MGMVVGLLPVASCLFRFQRPGRLATTSTLVTPLRDSATTLFVDFEDASAECLMLSRMRCTASLAGSISQVCGVNLVTCWLTRVRRPGHLES